MSGGRQESYGFITGIALHVPVAGHAFGPFTKRFGFRASTSNHQLRNDLGLCRRRPAFPPFVQGDYTCFREFADFPGKPPCNGRSLLQPGDQIVNIQSANISPMAFLPTIGCPRLFPYKSTCRYKHEGCLRCNLAFRICRSLLIVLVRFLLRTFLAAKLPSGRAARNPWIPLGHGKQSVPAGHPYRAATRYIQRFRQGSGG